MLMHTNVDAIRNAGIENEIGVFLIASTLVCISMDAVSCKDALRRAAETKN
jgi:hypothetical protein